METQVCLFAQDTWNGASKARLAISLSDSDRRLRVMTHTSHVMIVSQDSIASSEDPGQGYAFYGQTA